MIIGVQGTRNFTDYNIFLRAMGTALSSMEEEDKEFTVFACGPHNINDMVLEFVNVSERSLKARGLKVKYRKSFPSAMKQMIKDIDYFVFLSKPKESVSELVDLAEAKDIEVGVYRY